MEFDIVLLKTYLIALVTNRVIICAAMAWIVAQFLKVFTSAKYREEFSAIKFLTGSGGMPSSHSAVVCAACVSCGIVDGFNSAAFAISAVLAIVVMRDAAGIRREAGKQAEAINQVSMELKKKRKGFKPTHLSVLLGHTPLQVAVGAILGIAVAIACHTFLFEQVFMNAR